MKRQVFVLVYILIASIFYGCGGGESGSSTEFTTVEESKSQNLEKSEVVNETTTL